MIEVYELAIKQAVKTKMVLQRIGWALIILTLSSVFFTSLVYTVVFLLLTTMAFISSVSMDSRINELKAGEFEERLEELAKE